MAFYTTMSRDALAQFLKDYIDYQNNGGKETVEVMFSRWNGIYGEKFEQLSLTEVVFDGNGTEIYISIAPEMVETVEGMPYWEVMGIPMYEDDESVPFVEGSLYSDKNIFKEV